MVVALLALSCTFSWIFLLSSSAILATSSPIAIIHHQLNRVLLDYRYHHTCWCPSRDLLPSENGGSENLIDGRVRGGVLHLPSEPSKFFFILRLRFAVDKLCPI
jgi:hypothetical protein